MTSRKLVCIYLVLLIVILVGTAFVNYRINEFGLFGNETGEKFRIYHNERTTKHLYSYSYIPNNFDGILVGPSLSGINKDTKFLNNGNIYNLSLKGGNISELRVLVENVLKYGDIKTFIICLDPFITKDAGMKSAYINQKEFLSTFGSLFTLRYYVNKFLDIKKGEKSEFYGSYYGALNYRYKYKDVTSEDISNKIDERLSLYDNNEMLEFLEINETAFEDLKYVLESVRKRNIKVVPYYFPRPKRITEHPSYAEKYNIYRTKIDSILDYDSDIVIDFKTKEYDYIRDDLSSYATLGHLTPSGAAKVLKVIDEHLAEL